MTDVEAEPARDKARLCVVLGVSRSETWRPSPPGVYCSPPAHRTQPRVRASHTATRARALILEARACVQAAAAH
eukprot:1980482-Pleurochrysis_carterae.AAC.1